MAQEGGGIRKGEEDRTGCILVRRESIDEAHQSVICIDTVCTLIFARLNVRGFRGLAVIRESFVRENLEIIGYAQNNGQHLRIYKRKIREYGKSAKYKPQNYSTYGI